MKIIAVRIAPLPVVLALLGCIIVIGAPIEQGRGLPLPNLILALLYLVVGCAVCYTILQNQIIIDDRIIIFKRIFFKRCYQVDLIDTFAKNTSGGAQYHLKIMYEGNNYTHNISIYKYIDAMAVLEILLKTNPAIQQEMGARDAIRFKPDYW